MVPSTSRERLDPAALAHLRRDLDAARRGDLAALDRLLAGHRADFLRVARRTLGRRLAARVEVEDLVQEASMQAMKSITTLRSGELGGFRRWFFGILRHRVLLLAEAARPRVRPRRTTPLPDAQLRFCDPLLIDEPPGGASRRSDVGIDPALELVRALFADGRLTMVLHDVFTSGWSTVAFLLDRPSREAARQLHVRMRTRAECS